MLFRGPRRKFSWPDRPGSGTIRAASTISDEPAQGRLVPGMSDDGCRRRDFFALAISRSYFEVGGLPKWARCCDRANRAVREHLTVTRYRRLPPGYERGLMRLWLGGGRLSRAQARDWETPANPRRLEQPRDLVHSLPVLDGEFPRVLSACPTSRTQRWVCLSDGSIAGIAARASFWSTSSMLNCAHQRLEHRQRMSPCARRIPTPCPRSRARRRRRAPCRHRGARGGHHGLSAVPRRECCDSVSAIRASNSLCDAAGSWVHSAAHCCPAGSMPKAACNAGMPYTARKVRSARRSRHAMCRAP